MWEQNKSAKRRFQEGLFHNRYFVGEGIDVGGAPDPLAQFVGIFALLKNVRTWDLEDGDAQYMNGVPDNAYDFLHSSHCLEHMHDPRVALRNWIRVVKPGGFLIITVPDEDLYEGGLWPSRKNTDHKWSFTVCKAASSMPRSVNVVDLAKEFAASLELERLQLQREFFRDWLPQDFDQSTTLVAECGIEIIWRKRGPAVARKGS